MPSVAPHNLGDLCLTSSMDMGSCSLDSLSQWESLMGCIPQEVPAKRWSQSHAAAPFHAYLMAKSFCGLISVWDKKLGSHYNLLTTSELLLQKILLFWDLMLNIPQKVLGWGWLSSPLTCSNNYWIFKNTVSFGFHLENRSEHSHTRSLSHRLLEERWSVSITTGSSCERDKGNREQMFGAFFQFSKL